MEDLRARKNGLLVLAEPYAGAMIGAGNGESWGGKRTFMRE